MIATVVLKKGHPSIIGLEGLIHMSVITKLTGTKFMCNSTIISFNFPKACVVESLASKRFGHFFIVLSSSRSYNSFDSTETLDPKSKIACWISLTIVINILGIQTHPQDLVVS
jgi:hypothetical protein